MVMGVVWQLEEDGAKYTAAAKRAMVAKKKVYITIHCTCEGS